MRTLAVLISAITSLLDTNSLISLGRQPRALVTMPESSSFAVVNSCFRVHAQARTTTQRTQSISHVSDSVQANPSATE